MYEPTQPWFRLFYRRKLALINLPSGRDFESQCDNVVAGRMSGGYHCRLVAEGAFLIRSIKIVLLFSLISVPLLAAKFWERKPYEQWSKKESVAVLEDSPWGKTQKVHSSNSLPPEIAIPGPDTTPRDRGGGDRESSRLNLRRLFNIRFQSAKPVRMALARLSLLYRRRDHRQATELIRKPPFGDQFIVVAVSGSQGENHRRVLDQANLRQLGTHTHLALKGSGRRIELKRYVPPREVGGREAFFLFPRTREGKEQVTLKEKEIRFVSQLGWRTRLDRKFKLKDMVFDGILEF